MGKAAIFKLGTGLCLLFLFFGPVKAIGEEAEVGELFADAAASTGLHQALEHLVDELMHEASGHTLRGPMYQELSALASLLQTNVQLLSRGYHRYHLPACRLTGEQVSRLMDFATRLGQLHARMQGMTPVRTGMDMVMIDGANTVNAPINFIVQNWAGPRYYLFPHMRTALEQWQHDVDTLQGEIERYDHEHLSGPCWEQIQAHLHPTPAPGQRYCACQAECWHDDAAVPRIVSTGQFPESSRITCHPDAGATCHRWANEQPHFTSIYATRVRESSCCYREGNGSWRLELTGGACPPAYLQSLLPAPATDGEPHVARVIPRRRGAPGGATH